MRAIRSAALKAFRKAMRCGKVTRRLTTAEMPKHAACLDQRDDDEAKVRRKALVRVRKVRQKRAPYLHRQILHYATSPTVLMMVVVML